MIATIKKTNELLDKYGLSAKKGFGQNFIIEPKVVEKIAQNAHAENAVIEIGPGIGALTQQLSFVAKKVVAYEIDDALMPLLTEEFKNSNVEIVHQDFLTIDLKTTVDNLLKDYKQVVVCANLPYYITSVILFKIFESGANIPFITVMMQKEVADRFKAKVNTKAYNALSVIAQFYYHVHLIMPISPHIFIPKPNVDSAVIQFEKKPPMNIDEKGFITFVKLCFTQRRKTLVNNLKKTYPMPLIVDALQHFNLSLSVRAQEMSLDLLIELFQFFEGQSC